MNPSQPKDFADQVFDLAQERREKYAAMTPLKIAAEILELSKTAKPKDDIRADVAELAGYLVEGLQG